MGYSFLFLKKKLLPFMLLLVVLSLNNNNISTANIHESINQIDSTKPVLTLFSPTLGETHSSNKMKITLEARDETAWSSLKIRIGQIVLFDLQNDGSTLNSETLVYLNDYIFLDRLFTLNDQPKLDNRTVSIKITDTSSNFEQVFVNVDSDLEKPIINFEDSVEDLITKDSSVVMKWKVTDLSTITAQQVLLNGVPLSSDIELTEGVYSFNYELTEPIVEITRYTFSIIAFDAAGNTGRNSTTVTFVPKSESGSDEVTNLETLIVLLATVLGFAIIIIFIIRQNRDKTDQSLHKTWEGELVPPPLLELMEIQLKENPTTALQLTHTFTRIEDTWNETAEEMVAKSEITNLNMSDFIDTFRSNLMMELFSETDFSPDQFIIMEEKLGRWKSEIMLKPKRWKGTLKVPPLEEIVERYPTEKFSNYTEFVKTIGVLLDSWEKVSQKIQDLDKPTIQHVKAILNDYESETIILLAKTEEFSRIEINEIESSLITWMQKVL